MTNDPTEPPYNDAARIATITEAQKSWRAGISDKSSPYYPFISPSLSANGEVPIFNLGAYVTSKGYVKKGGFADLSNVTLFDVTQTFIAQADLSDAVVRSVLNNTIITLCNVGGNGFTVMADSSREAYDFKLSRIRGLYPTVTSTGIVTSFVGATLEDVGVKLDKVNFTGSGFVNCQITRASDTIFAALSGLYYTTIGELNNVTLAGESEIERPLSLSGARGTITFAMSSQNAPGTYPATKFQNSDLTIKGSLKGVDLTGSNFTGATINGTKDVAAALTALGYDLRRYPIITGAPSA